tara:strand:- start:3880 stop:4950 length:1071 start_codon:yes stop_codon:yes gene_type:complete
MRIYTGSYDQENFTLIQPDLLGPIVEKWEDGLRTSGENGELEWWYFDTKLEDGSLFVCYFYKIHPIKNIYFIGMNYNSIEGEDLFLMKFFKEHDVSFSKDSCNVQMGENFIKGNLKKYEIFLSPDDFDGFGIHLTLESNLKPYRPQDGIIKAGSNYFAWLAAVPNGVVDAKVTYNGREKKILGDGYHDHNWGNTPLQKLFDSWVWFRGKSGKNTVIAAELNTSVKRGGYKIPILYVANEEGRLVNRFGVDGLYTKYSDRIENVYNKTNEPLFSTIEMITQNGEILKITGNEIIDNADMFKRAPLPTYLRWVLPVFRLGSKLSSIDPYYTRFDSDLEISINDSVFKGFGVLEIMDLK